MSEQQGASVTRKLAQALAGKVTEQDWCEIVAGLVQSAKEGNAAAARLLIQAKFGSRRWLTSSSEETSNVSNRKVRLLKLLKTDVEGTDNDRDGTDRTADEVRVG